MTKKADGKLDKDQNAYNQADLGFVSVPTWYNRGVFGHSAEKAGCNVSLDVKWGMRECPTCGLFQTVPPLEKGELAECKRCGHHLQRRRRTMPFQGPLAFCFANAAIYLALLLVPLLRLNVRGHINTATLLTGPSYLAHHGFGSIATLVYLTSAVMPGCIISLLICVLFASRCKTLPRWGTVALVWFERLSPWSMCGIYMIGLIVAYTKLIDLAIVKILPGSWLLLALMVGIAAMKSVFNVDLIWRHASIDREGEANIPLVHTPPSHMLSCGHCGLVLASEHKVHKEADMGDCPRCGQILRKRKGNAMERCAAFLLAAIVCYLPANIYPVMSYTKLGKGNPSTIIQGVKELWDYHLYYLALIVLLASITVPVLKILALVWMLIAEKKRTRKHIVFLSYLYRFVARIGRWSMIDVFMISILVGLVRFGFFAEVLPEKGVIFFALVVILTIIAADLYDPRGLWDAAGLNRDSKVAEHVLREFESRKATQNTQENSR